MREWQRRPSDVANLFNPAYCAALLNRVAAGYQSTTDGGLPYALAFIALPLMLHSSSTSLLPRSANSRMHSWLLNTPEVVFGFDQRARSMAPFAREAIAFGIQNKVITYVAGARLVPADSKGIRQWQKMPENALICKQAQLLGKLLSQVKDVPTVFSLFGVRP
ncbi:DUF6521 family protein [Burkholderia vietnamiensis]|nr:three component ABC system middle component [Burkholderia vietnamiensis]MCO1348080.1 DUF6521 family protein [Burkholderia vietnamiensis]UQN48209.1 DUF6521 family protein [Burkholderia vietnamiensis]